MECKKFLDNFLFKHTVQVIIFNSLHLKLLQYPFIYFYLISKILEHNVKNSKTFRRRQIN